MNLEEACRACAVAIFNGQGEVTLEGKTHSIRRSVPSRLRYVAFKIGYEFFRVMEQNPKDSSAWAKKARTGKEIVWVLKGPHNIARLVDGQFTMVGKKESGTE